MRSILPICVCLVFGLTVIGCGSAKKTPPPQTAEQLTTKGAEDLKNRLKILSETGNFGSSIVAGLPEAIKELPADKSTPLLKDWEEMKRSGTETAVVKRIAKRMLEKL